MSHVHTYNTVKLTTNVFRINKMNQLSIKQGCNTSAVHTHVGDVCRQTNATNFLNIWTYTVQSAYFPSCF